MQCKEFIYFITDYSACQEFVLIKLKTAQAEGSLFRFVRFFVFYETSKFTENQHLADADFASCVLYA